MSLIYKICPTPEWQAAEEAGAYRGSADDLRDGFIHFSTRDQLAGTAAKHFAGQGGLVLIEVESGSLESSLEWEPSRDGALFPHLYGALPVLAVVRVWPLPLNDEGGHAFPRELDLG